MKRYLRKRVLTGIKMRINRPGIVLGWDCKANFSPSPADQPPCRSSMDKKYKYKGDS